METKTVVVTAVANHADPNDPQAVAQAQTTSDWAVPYLDANEDPSEPFADMYYPVIDSIDDVLIQVTEDTKALGSVMSRPTILPFPGFAVSLLFGQMGEEMLLGGVRAVPSKLLSSGFEFQHPNIKDALSSALKEVI